jgi:CheY-like chemotaxis protein
MAPYMTSQLRVLLAEDEPQIALAIESQITKEFQNTHVIRVRTEVSFLKALDLLQDDPPHLVIMDSRLPFGGSANIVDKSESPGPMVHAGARCIRELRERPAFRDTPIVVCTVVHIPSIQAQLSGVDLAEIQFVEKPWKREVLIAAIGSLLAAHGTLPEPKKKGVVSKIWEAVEAKVGIGGVSVDLKKVIE